MRDDADFAEQIRELYRVEGRLKRRLTLIEQEMEIYARLDWEEKVNDYVTDLQTGIEELNNAIPKGSRRTASCLFVEKTTGG